MVASYCVYRNYGFMLIWYCKYIWNYFYGSVFYSVIIWLLRRQKNDRKRD